VRFIGNRRGLGSLSFSLSLSRALRALGNVTPRDSSRAFPSPGNALPSYPGDIRHIRHIRA